MTSRSVFEQKGHVKLKKSRTTPLLILMPRRSSFKERSTPRHVTRHGALSGRSPCSLFQRCKLPAHSAYLTPAVLNSVPTEDVSEAHQTSHGNRRHVCACAIPNFAQSCCRDMCESRCYHVSPIPGRVGLTYLITWYQNILGNLLTKTMGQNTNLAVGPVS